MTERKSYEQLNSELDGYEQWIGRILYHRKSGAIYIVDAIQYKESDMSIEFSYHPEGWANLHFSRPIGELTDGRFSFTRL